MTQTQVPPHPGDILKSKVLEPLGLSVIELAEAINVPPNRLYLIIKGQREISVDTAVRLGRYLNMSASFWLSLQIDYQLYEYQQSHPYTSLGITPLKA